MTINPNFLPFSVWQQRLFLRRKTREVNLAFGALGEAFYQMGTTVRMATDRIRELGEAMRVERPTTTP